MALQIDSVAYSYRYLNRILFDNLFTGNIARHIQANFFVCQIISSNLTRFNEAKNPAHTYFSEQISTKYLIVYNTHPKEQQFVYEWVRCVTVF